MIQHFLSQNFFSLFQNLSMVFTISFYQKLSWYQSSRSEAMMSPASSPMPNLLQSFTQTPKLTKKQRENQAQLISKNLNFNLPIKLGDDNFIYWKTQILPIVRAFDLEDFICGATTCPAKFVQIIDEESGEMISAYNDDYLNVASSSP
ncbi:hypothetical protein ACOSP7_009118 [Xanthoceras sorbifolium]